jgi:hypothetical protein
MEDHPDRLACLLNITTATKQISLPQLSPLDYFKNFDVAALALSLDPGERGRS